MRALGSDRQRAFVCALLEQGGKRNFAAAYEAAGYKGERGSRTFCMAASTLARSENIQAALQEEARRHLTTLLPMSVAAIERIITEGKDADASKAAFGVMDRAGLNVVEEKQITVGLRGDTEMLARIRLLAERNGIPLEGLLGGRLARQLEPPTIDITPDKDEK